MNFDISHRTVYRYSAPVSQSHHLLHLTPRQGSNQTVARHALLIDPVPSSIGEILDDFGNPASIVTIEKDHSELVIHARSQVNVGTPPAIDAQRTSSWNDVAALLRANRGVDTFQAIAFACPSPTIRPSRDMHKFARPSFAAGRPIMDAVLDLTSRIYRDFTYDSGATDVATSVEDALRMKRGVCQDFAHVEIACLRSLGLAARYVSGYLLTRPPEGERKLQGADASHAWISVWAPETGWVDFDPTNDLIPGCDHITLAFGRDYQDVSPVSGVLLGGGGHEVEVAVDVGPVE